MGKRHLDYLGHRVGCGKVAVPELRAAAMAEYKKPITRRDLRAFLGSIGYYRRFIPMFASLSSFLTPATSTKAPGTVQWTPEMLDAFVKLRESLCNFCILTVPFSTDVFELHPDASRLGIGSVLNVVRDTEVLPVAVYSRQLRGSEMRSTTELEALAVCESVKHFAHFLYGATFTVLTDHKPLTALVTSKALNRRLRYGIKVNDLVIKYRRGADNCNADGLRRQAWAPELGEEGAAEDPVVFDLPESGLGREDCGPPTARNLRERTRT